jgi:hypothetical protein
MKGKPIEPGCLAMIVRATTTPENNGKVVNVLRRADKHYASPGTPLNAAPAPESGWVVETKDREKMLVDVLIGVISGRVTHKWLTHERAFAPQCLIRIDDGEAPKEITTPVSKAHSPDLDGVI